jgi:hypothetical protein
MTLFSISFVGGTFLLVHCGEIQRDEKNETTFLNQRVLGYYRDEFNGLGFYHGGLLNLQCE